MYLSNYMSFDDDDNDDDDGDDEEERSSKMTILIGVVYVSPTFSTTNAPNPTFFHCHFRRLFYLKRKKNNAINRQRKGSLKIFSIETKRFSLSQRYYCYEEFFYNRYYNSSLSNCILSVVYCLNNIGFGFGPERSVPSRDRSGIV